MLSRRQAIQWGLMGLAALSGCTAPSRSRLLTPEGACPLPEPLEPSGPALAVNARFHLFNLRDLPLADLLGQWALYGNREWPLSAQGLRLYGACIQSWGVESAPDVAEERRALAGDKTAPHRAVKEAEDFFAQLFTLLETWAQTPVWRQRTLLKQWEARDDRQGRLARLFQRYGGERMEDLGRLQGALAQEAPQGQLLQGKGPLSDLARWVQAHADWRERILAQAFEASGAQVMAVGVFHGSAWLETDQTPTEFPLEPLGEQLDYLQALAAKSQGRVLPLAPFDPWEQVLARSQDAVGPLERLREGPWAGVEMWPALGFRPWGNAKMHFFRKPAVAHFGAQVDLALADLYHLCAQTGLPLVARSADHSPSGFCYGLRSAPEHWAQLFEAKPELRTKLKLNLAQFGGHWAPIPQLETKEALICEREEADRLGWRSELAQLMACVPGLYADLGSTGGDRSAWQRELGPLLERFPHLADRLLWAADIGWAQLAHWPALPAGEMANFLEAVRPGLGEAVVRRNGARFFGVTG